MIKEYWTKYKEIITYIFFGVLTTVVSMGTYFIFTRLFHLDEMIANNLSWVFAVAFAFVTNKFFVFESKSWETSLVIKELVSFVSGRLFSLLIDNIVMFLGVKVFHINDVIVQFAKQVIVTVVNYIFGKWVFRKK